MSNNEIIDLRRIKLDGGTQMRVELNQSQVDHYASLMKEEKVKFPPIEVYLDGSDYWLVNGFHRYFAAKKAKLTDLHATVTTGTLSDAILAACGANKTNGVTRTIEDKRLAVRTMLEHEEWCEWSNRKIADHIGVTHPFVGKLRKELETLPPDDETELKSRSRSTPETIINEEPDDAHEKPQPFTVPEPKIDQETHLAPDPEEKSTEGFSLVTYRRELEAEVLGLIENENANQHAIGQTLIDLGNELQGNMS